MSVNDGGPAFPVKREVLVVGKDADGAETSEVVSLRGGPGMSLRDYFAAAALQGLAAKDGLWGPLMQDGHIVDVKRCYAMADAMLQERERAE